MASLTLACAAAFAMPPRPGLVPVAQPDGSTVEAEIYGDGTWCVYVASDGMVLEPDMSGALVPTGRSFSSPLRKAAALNAVSASAREEVRRVGSYPTKGKVKTLVILAAFADKPFVSENPAELMGRMISQHGFSDNGATGSVCDYFSDSSFGAFELDPTVVGPVVLPNGMAYYGAAVEGRPDVRPEEMIRDACALVDDEIDFKEFDLDEDGYIDNVYVFYPGYSQADGAAINTIWPHSGFAWAKLHAEFDGVRLDRYACSNEIDMSTNKLVGIGTFCHEFSHVLGLPDLYATDYSNEEHPGTWSIMASGGRNNNGHTPPLFSAYERYALGWIEPEELAASEKEYSIAPGVNKAFMVPASSENEYYLIENRQRSGWDAYLPGHGLLVWHIDYDEAAWKQNTVNNNASHQRIDLVEADRNSSSATRSGDSFPGAADVRELSLMKTWSGSALDAGLFNIREGSDGTVVFHVAHTGNMLDTPEINGVGEISPVSFMVGWNPVPEATGYVLDVYTKVRQGSVVSKVYVDGYRIYMTGDATSADVTGLTPSTEYFCVVRAMGGGRVSHYSAENAVTTLEPDFRSSVMQAASCTEVTSSGFTANWDALAGATGYMLTVSEVSEQSPSVQINDFADGIMTPDGWGVTPGCTTGSFTGYYGSMAPGLSMASDGASVQSPLSHDMITSLSFWYRGIKADDSHAIEVSGYDGREWRTLAEITSLVSDKAGATVVVESEFADMPCYSTRIKFRKPVTKGTLVIDDIKVAHTGILAQPLLPYDGIDVGNVLSFKVDGLKPSTLYQYSVTATDGVFTSVPSLPRMVRTMAESGIWETETGNGSECIVSTGNNVMTISNRGESVANVEVFAITGACMLRISLPGVSNLSLDMPSGLYIVVTDGVTHKVVM
ncbi:M6 family metalloprotease domain-containing protein [uncultured Muribaculum sp.]|nr:M6 family metalloprotease domain-containing protein [uncultured Muribaculum sp.]